MHGPGTNEFNFGDDLDHRPDPGVRSSKSGFTGLSIMLAFGGGLCSVSTSSLLFITCRSSGLYLGNYYGGGTGLIWLENLQCNGSEMSLDNCTHNGWGVHYCWHGEDVSILCADGTYVT